MRRVLCLVRSHSGLARLTIIGVDDGGQLIHDLQVTAAYITVDDRSCPGNIPGQGNAFGLLDECLIARPVSVHLITGSALVIVKRRSPVGGVAFFSLSLVDAHARENIVLDALRRIACHGGQ